MNIEIPKLFLGKKELIIAVIRGIFDTDGGIYLENKNKKLYPRMIITTISEKLANQLKNNLNSLDLRTTLYSQLKNKKYNRKREYILNIRGEEMFHKFMKIIKPNNPKNINKYRIFLNSKSL